MLIFWMYLISEAFSLTVSIVALLLEKAGTENVQQVLQDRASGKQCEQSWAQPPLSLFPLAVGMFVSLKDWEKEKAGKKSGLAGYDRWKRPKPWECILCDFPSKQRADSIAQHLYRWQRLMAFAAAQPFPGWQKVLPGHGHNPRVTSWAELHAAPARHLQLAFIIRAELRDPWRQAPGDTSLPRREGDGRYLLQCISRTPAAGLQLKTSSNLRFILHMVGRNQEQGLSTVHSCCSKIHIVMIDYIKQL